MRCGTERGNKALSFWASTQPQSHFWRKTCSSNMFLQWLLGHNTVLKGLLWARPRRYNSPSIHRLLLPLPRLHPILTPVQSEKRTIINMYIPLSLRQIVWVTRANDFGCVYLSAGLAIIITTIWRAWAFNLRNKAINNSVRRRVLCQVRLGGKHVMNILHTERQ